MVMSQLSSEDKNSYKRMVRALRKKIGMRQVPKAAKATLKARRRKVGETLLDLSIDIKRLCREAYPSLSPASFEQACIDHFTDALGVTLAKDIIRSKPLTLDKALSEALELEVLELRAIRMRERVVNEVSTHRGEANEMQNLSLPGWAPELSTMIASATAKAAAKAVVNAIPLAGVQGNRPPQFRQANDWGRGCWLCGSTYHFQRETSAGRGTDRKRKSRLPLHRFSPEQEKCISEETQTLLERDVIEPSTSPRNAQVVLASKKDGSYHYCVDFHRLNSVTVKEHYPVPRVEDMIDTLAGANFFSTLDLISAYHAFEIHPGDREKRAFSTKQGHWQ